LHVDDSLTIDVAGAKAAGLNAVWLNRGGRVRKEGEPEPDLEIRSLSDPPAERNSATYATIRAIGDSPVPFECDEAAHTRGFRALRRRMLNIRDWVAKRGRFEPASPFWCTREKYDVSIN
jgi:hypothetical protein